MEGWSELLRIGGCGRSCAVEHLADLAERGFHGEPFVFDGLIFILCLKGLAKITIDYKEYCLDANGAVVVLPKHICSIGHCSDDLDVRVVSVSADFMCHVPVTPDFNLLKKIAVHPYVKLEDGSLDDILKIHSMIGRYGSEDRTSSQIRDALIYSMLLMAASSFGDAALRQEHAFTRQETLVRQFFDLLIDSCEVKRSVSYFADKLCVTPKYLGAAVKSVSNYSAQSWINEAIVISAKRYIMTTDMTVHQISDKLDFRTASSFVRFFRMHVGCSPLDYRKRMNQEL